MQEDIARAENGSEPGVRLLIGGIKSGLRRMVSSAIMGERLKYVFHGYNIDAIFCVTCAEDVWSGMEKILYSDGKYLHFSKYGELPCIRAKERARGILIKVKNDSLQFSFHKIKFGIKINDRFQEDEANAIIQYLSNPDIADKQDKLNTQSLKMMYGIKQHLKARTPRVRNPGCLQLMGLRVGMSVRLIFLALIRKNVFLSFRQVSVLSLR